MNSPDLLDAAIHRHQARRLAKQIFFAWPNLEKASLRLADNLTEVIVDETGQPLFFSCMKAAFDGFRMADESDVSKMRAFIGGLLLDAPKLLDCHVYVIDGRQKIIWEPFLETLDAWRERHNGLPMHVEQERFVAARPHAVRALLASRIITVRDLAALGGDLDSVIHAPARV